MKQEVLDLHHRYLWKEKSADLECGFSEYSFSNIYLFRKVHQYQVAQAHGGRFFITGQTYDNHSFVMPLFDPKEVPTDYLVHILKGYDCFFPISESKLSSFDPDRFRFDYNPDDSDYVYAAEKLGYYKGRSLSPIRNLKAQFLARFAVTDAALTKDRLEDAKEILAKWKEDVGQSNFYNDYLPCLEALSLLQELGLEGRIYYAANEPAGFLLYDQVFPSMSAIHFAKAKRKFKGAYQYMFSHIAKHHKERFNQYNFEQDLGKPNIRQAKKAYFPDRLLKKYRVTPL